MLLKELIRALSGVRTLYGLFKGDIFPLAITMLFGQIMAVLYESVFVLVTIDRPAAVRTCGIAAVPVVLTNLYGVLAWADVTGQSTPATANVLGYASVLASLCFFSSPFATIRDVTRSKNAASIPITMCTVDLDALWPGHQRLVCLPAESGLRDDRRNADPAVCQIQPQARSGQCCRGLIAWETKPHNWTDQSKFPLATVSNNIQRQGPSRLRPREPEFSQRNCPITV